MASAAPEIPVLARDQAFETLYRRHVKDVYHYALALLRNPADAEDVTQTTFMNAYRAYKRGDEILKPQHWLIKNAHNVARTRYARASRRVKEVPLEDHIDQLALPEEERPNVVGVLQALGRLPFNQRAALVMRELEGRSYVEIADTLGVSVSAVETLIFRGRRSLRLRASALRTLAAVPLPSSLTHLFEGGGVVAGGGALAGSGLLAKATVVLLAGAIATGIGSDRTRPATAASKPDSLSVAAPPWATGDGFVAWTAPGGLSLAGTGPAARRSAAARSRPPGAFPVTKTTSAGGMSTAGATSTGEAPSAAGTSITAGATQTVSGAVAPVTEVVDTVEETVSETAESLPVEAPSLPPVQVDPPLPAPPPLPLP
jgi:RNA polymerase sigma factor (sigma-70 family)